MGRLRERFDQRDADWVRSFADHARGSLENVDVAKSLARLMGGSLKLNHTRVDHWIGQKSYGLTPENATLLFKALLDGVMARKYKEPRKPGADRFGRMMAMSDLVGSWTVRDGRAKALVGALITAAIEPPMVSKEDRLASELTGLALAALGIGRRRKVEAVGKLFPVFRGHLNAHFAPERAQQAKWEYDEGMGH